MLDNSEEKKIKIKLFACFPICTLKIKNGKKTFKMFGIPFFKRKEKNDGHCVKYYILGIPVLKIKQRYAVK